MTSIHDKYHSQLNKNYIYELACKIIKKEYQDDVSSEQYFKDVYENNIQEVFDTVDTDDLVVLNRRLLYTQIGCYKKYVGKPVITNKTLTVNVMARIIDKDDSLFSFKVSTPPGEYHLKTLIVAEQKCSLFNNPLIILTINDRDIHVKMTNKQELHNRVFIEYEPLEDQEISLEDITVINIKNALNETINKSNFLKVNKVSGDAPSRSVEVSGNDYKCGDTLIINEKTFYIDDIINDICIQDETNHIKENDGIINVSESPILIFN